MIFWQKNEIWVKNSNMPQKYFVSRKLNYLIKKKLYVQRNLIALLKTRFLGPKRPTRLRKIVLKNPNYLIKKKFNYHLEKLTFSKNHIVL